jgi:MFS family permease
VTDVFRPALLLALLVALPANAAVAQSAVSAAVQGVAANAQNTDEDDSDDPWSEEAEQLLEDSERVAREDQPAGPVDFADSPWAAPLLVAGATTLSGILYAGAFVAGTGWLYQQVPTAPGWILFAGFLAAPLLPALGAGVASLVVARWWKAALTLAGALLGGGLGVVVGMAGLFLIGPLLADPATFIWFSGLGVPLVVTGAAAIGTAVMIPVGVTLLEDTLGWELPRALRDPPAE